MSNNQNGDEFFTDASGQLRKKGDFYIDYSGQLRGPNDFYIDASGQLRAPGDMFIDESGNLRAPGDVHVDGAGNLTSAMGASGSCNSSDTKYYSSSVANGIPYAPARDGGLFKKIVIRVILTLFFISGSVIAIEEYIAPLYELNYLKWLALPALVSIIIFNVLAILLFTKKRIEISTLLRVFILTIISYLYYTILSNFNFDSQAIAAFIILSLTIGVVGSIISRLPISIAKRIKRKRMYQAK